MPVRALSANTHTHTHTHTHRKETDELVFAEQRHTFVFQLIKLSYSTRSSQVSLCSTSHLNETSKKKFATAAATDFASDCVCALSKYSG